jgi:hypothetical protein
MSENQPLGPANPDYRRAYGIAGANNPRHGLDLHRGVFWRVLSCRGVSNTSSAAILVIASRRSPTHTPNHARPASHPDDSPPVSQSFRSLRPPIGRSPNSTSELFRRKASPSSLGWRFSTALNCHPLLDHWNELGRGRMEAHALVNSRCAQRKPSLPIYQWLHELSTKRKHTKLRVRGC